MTLVGRGLPRREDARVLSGRTEYLDDLEPPGTAHLAFVRSDFAHARVLSISPPDRAPGLLAVLTARDLEGWARPSVASSLRSWPGRCDRCLTSTASR